MVFSGVAPASARGSQGGSLVLVGAGSQHGHTDTGLQLWVTRFQDSQAKSFKTQDNFATVNAGQSERVPTPVPEESQLLGAPGQRSPC